MSHARPNQNTGASSLLVSDRGLIGTYTANAATVSKKRSVCEPVSMAHCVPPCTSKSKHGRVELARKRQGFDWDVYGECRDSEQKAKRLRTCQHGSLRPLIVKSKHGRVELARVQGRRGIDWDVYGECRDSEQKAKRLRTCQHGSLRPAMHVQIKTRARRNKPIQLLHTYARMALLRIRK